jgi:O-methyltransferase
MNTKEFIAFDAFTKPLIGHVAEVGVCKGDSAEELLEHFKGREIHLFDTFTGVPNTCIPDVDGGYKGGEHFKATVEQVVERFSLHKNIHIYPGIFPATADAVKDLKFCFVNMDADIYQSTKDCWEFFYPRLCYGGVFYIQDDYPGLPGVKKATDEFLADKPEILRSWPYKDVDGPVYIIKG